MDNSTTQTQDNGTAQTQQTQQQQTTQQTQQTQQTNQQTQQQADTTTQSTQQTQTAGTWQDRLTADLKGALEAKRFANDDKGLVDMATSYLNLEKLVGQDKVPIPKDANDKEGWERWSKAMGVPSEPTGYNFEDIKYPDNMKGKEVNKAEFSQVAHQLRLTPTQAAGLWKVYNDSNISGYQKQLGTMQDRLQKMVTNLKSEWGAAYETNVEIGQAVISQFSDDQDMNDFITSQMLSDPRGVKFMKKLGEQFAENTTSDFNIKRFSLTPAEAKSELEKMRSDVNGPYFNRAKKFTQAEQDAAIERHNNLQLIINRAKG